MVNIRSFSPSPSFCDRTAFPRRRPHPTSALRERGGDGRGARRRHPRHAEYGMGGRDLSGRWIELVHGGHVAATTELKDEGDGIPGEGVGVRVRYGVRLEERDGPSRREPGKQPRRLLEFVEMLSPREEEDGKFSELRDRIRSINGTLTDMQQSDEDRSGGNSSHGSNDGLAIKCVYDGPYAAQPQLVRTLRPPRSKDMSRSSGSTTTNSDDRRASCRPPPYDASGDSFLVGPLRLYGHGEFHGEGPPRVRAARVLVPLGDGNGDAVRPWDVFHNISPVDPRGHYLILPALDDVEEWRDQSLSPNDCQDVTYLASTIEPPGSMVLFFNSVGAGASQNHIHCHACVCPPPPLLCREDVAGSAASGSRYAVSKARATSSLHLASGVVVSLLEYPCTCVKLSSALPSEEAAASAILKEMGDALDVVVRMAQKMDAPHNVAWTNERRSASENLPSVDAYVFIRRAETSAVLSDGDAFRLGASEMLGVFHSSSREQLESLSNNMGDVLSDVSWEPREAVWKEVCEALEMCMAEG